LRSPCFHRTLFAKAAPALLEVVPLGFVRPDLLQWAQRHTSDLAILTYKSLQNRQSACHVYMDAGARAGGRT
jgi:hypothetical protein